jgi:hypothetical protein
MAMTSPQAMYDFGRTMLPSGRFGLGEAADTAVAELGRHLFGQASAAGAFRGQLTPENQTAVIGAALQNALPFLIPQIQQYQTTQFLAPMSLMQLAKTSADYWNRALGAQSDASSFGFGFMAQPPISAMFKGGG